MHSLGIFRRLADLSIVQFESDLILHGSREAFQDFERVNEKQPMAWIELALIRVYATSGIECRM